MRQLNMIGDKCGRALTNIGSSQQPRTRIWHRPTLSKVKIRGKDPPENVSKTKNCGKDLTPNRSEKRKICGKDNRELPGALLNYQIFNRGRHFICEIIWCLLNISY